MRIPITIALIWDFFGAYLYSISPNMIDLVISINAMLVIWIAWGYLNKNILIVALLIATPTAFQKLILLSNSTRTTPFLPLEIDVIAFLCATISITTFILISKIRRAIA